MQNNSKNINEMYKNTLDAEKLQKQVQKSTEFYAQQPFVKENYGLFYLAKIFHFIFSIFSIITGFGFLYFLFADYVFMVIAGIMASLILFGLELVKSIALQMSIKKMYQNRFSGLALFALMCVSASILFSVLGAKELFEHLDKSVQEHKTTQNNALKTLTKEYDKKIAEEKQELQSFKESVSWQGKINLHDNNIAKNINGYLGRVDSLISQKNKSLQKMSSQTDKENEILLKESNFNLWAWLWVSLSNEILLVLCVWYACHYHWHTQKEKAILTNTHTYKTTAEELQNFLDLYLSTENKELLAIEASNNVGFEIGKKDSTADHTTSFTAKSSFGIDICKNCGTQYERKTHNQKFCGEACRIEAWEKRTGKKLKFKK